MTKYTSSKLSILDRLQRGDVLISDGGTGTYLQQHGLEPGGCPEEMNVTLPDVVRGMASDYFDAGSDMVLTNSFGGNKFMLKKYGHGNQVEKFNRLAAEHARSQAPEGHYVGGSIGPTGEFLEPLGEVSEQEMLEAFIDQATALEKGGADAVVIETKTAIEEVRLAIKATKENTDLTIMSTMTFDKGPRGFFTMMGVTPEQAVIEMEKAGADVVGTNCGNGIDIMIEIAHQMRKATDVPMIIHSNAGIPAIIKGRIVYPETPNYMAEKFKVLYDMKVNILGGCCGTTPKHINQLAATLNR